ncbi:MAG: hypothetical protein ACRC6B_11900 [Fusobacteriaceae bacterium]
MNDITIWKGNLSVALREDIIAALHKMLESEVSAERQFAITTFLTHKRELSEWPANDWTNSQD